jgi:hypothetical protein
LFRKYLRVLSQNVWCHYFAASPAKNKRIQILLNYLSQEKNNYDVLLLQEIFILRQGPFIHFEYLK